VASTKDDDAGYIFFPRSIIDVIAFLLVLHLRLATTLARQQHQPIMLGINNTSKYQRRQPQDNNNFDGILTLNLFEHLTGPVEESNQFINQQDYDPSICSSNSPTGRRIFIHWS
jgi:hypothetical protein